MNKSYIAMQAPYLNEGLILISEAQDPYLAGFIKALDKFGVCGIDEKPSYYKTIIKFLREHNISHDYNERYLIWLSTIKPGLKQIFRNKYDKN